MNAPHPSPPYPVRRLRGACPFCNEALAELWRDAAREDFGFQVRCALCEARGPWASEEGAPEAWAGVRPSEV